MMNALTDALLLIRATRHVEVHLNTVLTPKEDDIRKANYRIGRDTYEI